MNTERETLFAEKSSNIFLSRAKFEKWNLKIKSNDYDGGDDDDDDINSWL